jgi:putative addiction module CopG family antidote
MNVALTEHFENLIHRLVESGRYNNASEVVRDALRKLEAEDHGHVLPPGSLRHVYGAKANAAERKTAHASTLKVEPE